MTHRPIRHACVAAALAALAHGQVHAQNAPTAHVAEGDLVGLTLDGVDHFRGIPYAQAPIGHLRWAAPQPALPWSGPRDATRHGAACPQAIDPFADNLLNSEDCLSLNVYAPQGSTAAPRPVIVWIPGGGSVLGSSRQYDAQRLAQATKAVIVTVNYRLGALGGLWTSGMQAEAKGHNFALQDQQEALRWVQRNISQFNGDPHKVTLTGHSVGGIAVSLHLVSPTAAGLFQRAMMFSGVALPDLQTSNQAAAQGDAFATRLGCTAGTGQMDCLRGKSAAEILAVSPTYADIGRGGLYWNHFIDGSMVVSDVNTALAKGKFNRVPVMVGTTLDEGRGFVSPTYHLDGTPMTQEEYAAAAGRLAGPQLGPVLTNKLYPTAKLGSPALAFSQLFTDSFSWLSSTAARHASAYVPTFAYEFADRTAPEFFHDPFMPSGAFHASDLLYWFQTPVAGAPIALNPTQKRLSDQMQRYWKQFAETGNPNGVGTPSDPTWPRFNWLSTPFLTLAPDAIHLQEWGSFQRAHQEMAWSILFGLRRLQ